MDITSIASNLMKGSELGTGAAPAAKATKEEIGKTASQFEGILVRQFLGESMKNLLEKGPSGQVCGYLITDSLANGICKGGGFGLAHILQSQLTKEKP